MLYSRPIVLNRVGLVQGLAWERIAISCKSLPVINHCVDADELLKEHETGIDVSTLDTPGSEAVEPRHELQLDAVETRRLGVKIWVTLSADFLVAHHLCPDLCPFSLDEGIVMRKLAEF